MFIKMSIKALKALGINEAEFKRQVREARKRGEWSFKYEPRAVSARYDNGQVTVGLLSGWSFSFDPRMYHRAFRTATEDELADVKPLGMGFALEWTTLDQHLGVGPLILDLVGDKYLTSELSRRNGEVTSEKKKAASRANGKLGGRPRKGD